MKTTEKTYKIEMNDPFLGWCQYGCWGGENCVNMTLDEAETDIAVLREGYPECEWRIIEEKEEEN